MIITTENTTALQGVDADATRPAAPRAFLSGIRARWSRSCAAIALVCTVIICTVWAVTYERIVFEREDDIAQAVQINENLALAFGEQVGRTLVSIDHYLLMVKNEFEREGPAMNPDRLSQATMLDPSAYLFVSILDAKGDVVLSSNPAAKGINVADRDYFARHLSHAEGRLLVSHTVPSRVSGRLGLLLSRRINRADGGFGGVVVAGVNPALFSGFYDRINLGPAGLAELVTLDGTNLIRHTGDQPNGGLDMRSSTLIKRAALEDSGSYFSLGRYDSIQRYISFRVLREHGLVIAVGMSRDYVLKESRVRLGWYLLGSSLATLFVLVFGWGLVAATRKQQRAMEAARAGEALYRVTFEQAAVGIAHNAMDGHFVRVNAKYCAMLGFTEAELRSRTFMDVLHPEDVPPAEQMQQLMEHGCLEIENRHVCKDGSIKWTSVAVSIVRDVKGNPDYMVAMVQDITERNEAQAKLLHQAHYDELTGLPNRLLLLDRLSQSLKQARRKEQTVGVLFVNLDRFKAVNDTLGRDNGDLLLREAASRLNGTVRAQDSVARAGGDEFVVVLPEIHGAEDAARVARKIVDAMAAPFCIAGHEIFVTASVGIALFPGDGPDGEILLRNADAAMARAKQIGRDTFQYYTPTMNERAPEKLLLEADLRRALERGEFRLHYQPKVSLSTGRVTGLEALLRWQRADGKLVAPGDFIPLLEESGMIGAVGNWVIRAACDQIRGWQLGGLVPVPVAVNVATKQFLQNDLYAVVDGALRASGVDSSLLEIEITESNAMQDHDHVVPVLKALNERGVHVAIDDFGTGYSSLGYLAKLPIQALKIDRSFVIRMHDDPNAMTLVSTIISLAHSLKLKVIAEGVETENQSSLLRLLRCDEMQGYLFSRPVPASDCTRYLDTTPAREPAQLVAA